MSSGEWRVSSVEWRVTGVGCRVSGEYGTQESRNGSGFLGSGLMHMTDHGNTGRGGSRTVKLTPLSLMPDVPLEVDAGCGLGHFLVYRATQFPQSQFVGIERMLDRVRRTQRKIDRAGLKNAQVLRAEVVEALTQAFPPNRIDRLFILFPDPWPKRRHHRRRLINAAFVDLLARRLKPGGAVYLATDQADYGDVMRACFEADGRFEAIPPLPREPAAWTRFEQLFREQHLPIGEAGFRLIGTLPPLNQPTNAP